MKKILVTTILVCSSTLLMADGGAIFKSKCASCHGADAKTKALGKSAVIAGQSAGTLTTKLKGYKAGTLNAHGMGTVMNTNVKAMSDSDLKAVAGYISKL